MGQADRHRKVNPEHSQNRSVNSPSASLVFQPAHSVKTVVSIGLVGHSIAVRSIVAEAHTIVDVVGPLTGEIPSLEEVDAAVHDKSFVPLALPPNTPGRSLSFLIIERWGDEIR